MVGVSSLISLPVAGSSSRSLTPDQNEPNARNARPSERSIRNGSIALKSSRGSDFRTRPRSRPVCGGRGDVEGVVGHQPDRAGVSAKGRQRVIEEDRLAAPADGWGPDVDRPIAQRVLRPSGHAIADHARVGPPCPVGRRLCPDRPPRRPCPARPECGEPAVDLDHRGVVDADVAGHRRLDLPGERRRRGEREKETEERAQQARLDRPRDRYGARLATTNFPSIRLGIRSGLSSFTLSGRSAAGAS